VRHRRAGDRCTLRAGPAFSVQVKSAHGPVPYEAGIEAEWLADQESPLFLCIVHLPSLTCELYSTWNMRNGHLLKGALRTELHPGTLDQFTVPTLVYDALHVPLGPPVLRLTPADVVDPADAMRWADILESWILIDRENIVNSRAGMYWTMGPNRWVTNEPLPVPQLFLSGFYHNPLNLDRCVDNLLRSAVAVRRIMDHIKLNGVDIDRPGEEAALDALLEAFEPHLDPVARHALRERDTQAAPVQPH